MALTAAQLEAGSLALDPEFSYLLSDRGVATETRGRLGHFGVTRLNVFAKIETTEADFREWARTTLALDPAIDPLMRVAQAILVDAWEAAKGRVAKQAEVEAEARVLGIPKLTLKGTQLQLRKAYVLACGPLPDKFCPSRTYVDWRLEQLEEGELRPERLRQVTTVEDEDDEGGDAGTLDISREGTLRFRRGKVMVNPPSTPEQLRKFLRVMAAHWEFVRIKDPVRTFLVDHTPAVWSHYADFLLGEDCWGMEAKDGAGAVCARPTWLTLLSYDFEIRKQACRHVNERAISLKLAMEAAMKDQELRTKYLVSPMAIAAQHEYRRPAGQPGKRGDAPRAETGAEKAAEPPPPKHEEKPKNRKNRRDKDKKSDKDKDAGSRYNRAKRSKGENVKDLHYMTPDKKRICFACQKKACKRDQCQFAHVCAKCFKDHPYEDCPEAAQGA